jgi:hypothetical protein
MREQDKLMILFWIKDIDSYAHFSKTMTESIVTADDIMVGQNRYLIIFFF